MTHDLYKNAVTVAELIERLQKLPQDAIVVQYVGGGGEKPHSSVGVGWYEAEQTWSGDFFDEEDAEEYGTDTARKAVILYHVH